jgi:hypothetical protein
LPASTIEAMMIEQAQERFQPDGNNQKVLKTFWPLF